MPSQRLPSNIQALVQEAKTLYEMSFLDGGEDNDLANEPFHVSTAPGRVNLIGEHTDYTGGYVLPLAIGYGTVCYGRGRVVKTTAGIKCACRIVSSQHAKVVEFEAKLSLLPSDSENKWANYVQGVILQYLPDLANEEETLQLDVAIAGDVPLGSGLSSSASLEVATAVFLESILSDRGFSSYRTKAGKKSGLGDKERKIERALRCQRAENTFCGVPCGVMDQFVSSAGCHDKVLLIDCRSLDFREVSMAVSSPKPVLVITNSNVKHDLGGSEYPVRVKQCKEATEILQSKINSGIVSLRDATVRDIEEATTSGALKGVLLQRARHVVSENQRTEDTADALEKGDWALVGKLMNLSHESMRNDYEVSCKEIDFLVDLAQKFEGVYGSRLTGGGFGGCAVTLVDEGSTEKLQNHLKEAYEKHTGMTCNCFVTSPANGACLITL
mmetsp:Transcript_2716/g.4993  ORF Transcript_2716/g.4993 Transcript_2716/m.4993 type:complete len:442 (+) Transcript_2716:304-1629(+)